MEYFKRFLIWVVSGIGLACGVAIVSWVSDRFDKPEKDLSLPLLPKKLPVSTVQVSSVELIPISEYLSASAFIFSSEKSTLNVELELNLYKDGKVIFSCKRPFSYSPTGVAQRVQVDCFMLKHAEIPAGSTVTILVNQVETRTW